MTTTLQELRHLKETVPPQLNKLERYQPSVTFMRLLGLDRSELFHSRALEYLLDNRRSPVASALASRILRATAKRLPEDHHHLGLQMNQAADSVRLTRCRREYPCPEGFIDIVLRVESDEGNGAVLAFENKIDAWERDHQISDYQKAIGRLFPTNSAAVIFLTPLGREPRTSDRNAPVPAVMLGYDILRDILMEVADETGDGPCEWVLRSLARHIEEEVMGGNSEREMVMQLWRQYPAAMRAVVAHRPRLKHVRTQFERHLQEALPPGISMEVTTLPSQGNIREIKVMVKQWNAAGLPLTFMLVEERREPTVRLLVRNKEDLRHQHNTVNEWADWMAEAAPDVAIDQLTTEWEENRGWFEVCVEGRPARKELGELWDERAVRGAVSWILQHMTILQPAVEAWRNHNRSAEGAAGLGQGSR